MQSPAPRKQKIAGRSESSKESTDDIIENIEVVRQEEYDKDSPETDGGSKRAVEGLARDRRWF
jgi:hypothetical protein